MHSDLRVTVNQNLKADSLCHTVNYKSCRTIHLIRRPFRHTDIHDFVYSVHSIKI